MTEAHPLRRRHLELIALNSDRATQTTQLGIFFPELDPDDTIRRLADYRHLLVMQDKDQAHKVIAELIQQAQEARTP